MAIDAIKATVATLNVRGLCSKSKRLSLFEWAVEKKIDILFLQETFWTSDYTKLCQNEWNGSMYIQESNSVHSKGVAILISKYLKHNIINIKKSTDGRTLGIIINIENVEITLINAYAPNNCIERIHYFNDLKQFVKEMPTQHEHIVISGDLNTIDNPIDRMSGNMERCKESFTELKNNLNLIDSWRYYNPNLRDFTYFHPTKPQCKSRIDYILLNKTLNKYVKDINIFPAPVPDHKCVQAKIIIPKCARGPGYWKLNVSILAEIDYKDMITEIINTTIEHYYDHLSARDLLDFLKIRIKESTIKYCTLRNRTKNFRLKNLENEINSIDCKLNDTLLTISEKNEIISKRISLQHELDKTFAEKAEGARIRAKCKMMEQGERNTSFFHRLEKHRQSNNRIDCLKSSDNKLLTSDCDILNETQNFYQNLYTSENINDQYIEEYLNNTIFSKTLSQDDSSYCDGYIDKKECTKALFIMGNDKSPGIDGLPIEFYKTFWNIIGDTVINSFNESFDNGELSNSQKKAILSLIFKKGDTKLLKNYRPISLTNTDYRILTFTLSLRLQKVIDSIVGQEQTAYIKSRFIGTNARMIEDIIEYCNKYNKAGLILFLDFEKAFDTVEWNFMFKVLNKFNFGSGFINWIKTLYTNPLCLVKNNGYFSNIINLSRGIRQGCAISAIIFILVVEVLSLNLKQNTDIKGIKIPLNSNETYESLISQYADDLSLMLENEESILPSLNTVKKFSDVVGLKLNLDKTEGLWLGSEKHRQKNCHLFELKWPEEPIRALGIYVGHNKDQCYHLNWTKKLELIKEVADIWSLRKLTLIGKIYIIKSELLSKIIYTATILPIPEGLVTKVNKIFYKFIWGNSEKVQRKIINNDYDKGGLKMVDLDSQFSAIKAAWIPRYLNDCKNLIPWTFFSKILFA